YNSTRNLQVHYVMVTHYLLALLMLRKNSTNKANNNCRTGHKEVNMSSLKPQEIVRLGDIQMANHLPFVLFGGMNVLESKDLAFEIAETYVDICKRLDIPYVFKASFDKANRSSLNSFRGPGLEKGIEWLAD